MIRSAPVVVAVGLLAPCCAMGINVTCPDPPPAETTDTVVFDHLNGAVLAPSPAVLELRDGDVFAIEFCNTFPSGFEYEITPIEAGKEREVTFDAGTGAVSVDWSQLTSTELTWKHDEVFSLYKVSVTVRQGTPNPAMGDSPPAGDASAEAALEEPVYLYSYTFPVWVRTISWTMSFTSGVAFSELVDDKFFIETDTKGTTETTDDTKLVLRNRSDLGDSRPDLVAFVNLLTPEAGWWGTNNVLGGHLGVAFGLGLNGEGEPRYYFGPSWTIGRKRYFVLTAGWTGGHVDQLPPGQRLDEPPLNDNVLSQLDSSFEHGFFAGLTFSFNPRDEKDLITALAGKAGRTDTGQSTPAEDEEDEEE